MVRSSRIGRMSTPVLAPIVVLLGALFFRAGITSPYLFVAADSFEEGSVGNKVR